MVVTLTLPPPDSKATKTKTKGSMLHSKGEWGRHLCPYLQMGVSKNNDTPKSSILIGFSIINHPFWGTPIFGNIQISLKIKDEDDQTGCVAQKQANSNSTPGRFRNPGS